MPHPDQVEIERIVEHYQKSSPVPVERIANALGIQVKKTKKWPDLTSGAIAKQDDQYIIWINANHPETRQRFTIAHEIAHFVLHRDLIGDGIHDDAMYRSELHNSLERHANTYAAQLLMPWPLIEECAKGGVDYIEDLAARLGVSKTAMSIRLGFPWE